MRDLFGREVTMEEARALARRKPPSDRRSQIALRLAKGAHPHSGLPLREPGGETCGSCAHHRVKRFANRYHKCALTNGGGPATDIRVSWPACVKWEAQHA